MNGIDISGYQSGMYIPGVDAEFVIVKVSEGTWYESPYWREQADATLASGKLLGFYHYASGTDAEAEAALFADLTKDYIGKAIFCLDWESGSNAAFSRHDGWTRTWHDVFKASSGVEPFIYTSYWAAPWNPAFSYIWIAQYANYDITYYQEHPWNEGAYECDIRQYAGEGGRVAGYDGAVDLDKSYFDKARWLALQEAEESEWVQDPRIATFCDLMNLWCCDMDMHYSQKVRWDFSYGGSADCSSTTVYCLKQAGFDTGVATWTGNMSVNLEAYGWYRVPVDGNPQKGDILLNDSRHVGIWDGEQVVEFGGDPHLGYVTRHDYYDYPWNCYLRFPLTKKKKEEDAMEMVNFTVYDKIITDEFYPCLLHREADFGGSRCQLRVAVASGFYAAACSIISSDEWQAMMLSGTERVKDFYKAFLGREASDEEAEYWIDATGGDLYAVAESIIGSQEARDHRASLGLQE